MFPFPNPMCAGGLLQSWTFNASDKAANVTLSNADRDMSVPPGWGGVRGTVSKSTGSYYFEQENIGSGSAIAIALATADLTAIAGSSGQGYAYMFNGVIKPNGGTNITGLPTHATGDVLGCAFNGSAVWFSKNGVWISGDPNTGSGGTARIAGAMFPAAWGGGAMRVRTPLKYYPPAGFAVL